MLDSDFWREMADKFRVLDPTGCLRLEWSYFRSLNSFQVELIETGDFCRSVRAQFEAYGTRAGAKCRLYGSRTALLVWLQLLATRAPNDRPKPLVSWQDKDDPSVQHQSWGGCVMHACIAAANLCNALEVESFERERSESRNPQSLDAPLVSHEHQTAFSQRAAWLRARLKERGWDHNSLWPNGGPDRKTVQKIIDGKYVRAEVLPRLVNALNHKKINGITVSLIDIPSD